MQNTMVVGRGVSENDEQGKYMGLGEEKGGGKGKNKAKGEEIPPSQFPSLLVQI